MSNELDIKFVIKMCGGNEIPAELLWKTLQLVNDAIYFAEVADLNEIGSSFPEIPQVALDAARYRMKENRGKALLIETTSSINLGVKSFKMTNNSIIIRQ